MLEQFKKDPLYSKTLVYWVEEWKSLSKKIKNGLIGIDIVNIRTVLLDLINEYELNKFESENNRKVYIALIENLNREKHIHLYRDELMILKERLEKKDISDVYVIAKEISNKLSSENFSKILFDELLLILERKLFSKTDRAKIQNLTKDIIIELVNLGMSAEDIDDLVIDSFKTYSIIDDDEEEPIIHFKYTPVGLSPKQAKEYIDNLTLKDRLSLLIENLTPQKSDYHFIFPLWGMLANLKYENETLLDIEIYNPEREKKLRTESFFDETFKIDTDSNNTIESRFNVVVRVQAISAHVAKQIAEEKYLFFLRIINLEFSHSYTEFYWDGQYIGMEKDSDQFFGTAFGIDGDERVLRRNISRNSPVYLSDEKYDKIKKYSTVIDILKKREMHIEVNSIINVIELMSKSIWETDENKLLNYWICLESLANISKNNNETKFTFIKETVSNMFFLWERFSPLHNLFSLTRYYTTSSYRDDNSINIPKEFIEDVGIIKSRSEGSVISLYKFYNRMDELLNYTTLESFLDEVEFTIDFYKENKIALQKLRKKRKEVNLTIDYIYKSRNQIVHNGYVAKNLIPYLVKFAEGYATSLLQRIIDVYLEDEFDLQSYFIKERYEGNLLEKKLSSNDYYEIGLKE